MTRVLVKITNALKPGNFVLYKGAPSAASTTNTKATVQQVVDGDGLVLWDLKHVRLASDHRPFKGTPDDVVSDTDGAYQNDEFFTAATPPAVVHRKGESVNWLEYCC